MSTKIAGKWLVVFLLHVGAGKAWCGSDSVENRKAIGWEEGVAIHSCAPYDGVAFEVQIPLDSKSRILFIRVNESLGDAMSRRITGIGKPGGAAVLLCPVHADQPKDWGWVLPKVNYASCVDAVTGIINLKKVVGEEVSGSVSAAMRNGETLDGTFKAKIFRRSSKQIC